MTNFRVFEPEEGKDYRHFTSDAPYIDDIVLTRSPDGRAVVRGVPHAYVVHSPTGFEWGYCGSGPADLALNILCLVVEPPEAWRLHQRFKEDMIATMPRDGGIIRAVDVRDWVLQQWSNVGKAEWVPEGLRKPMAEE